MFYTYFFKWNRPGTSPDQNRYPKLKHISIFLLFQFQRIAVSFVILSSYSVINVIVIEILDLCDIVKIAVVEGLDWREGAGCGGKGGGVS